MKKILLYLLLHLVLAAVVGVLLFSGAPGDFGYGILMLLVLVITSIVLLVLQVFLIVLYAVKKKNFDFLFVFTNVFAAGFLVLYINSVVELMRQQERLTEILVEVEKMDTQDFIPRSERHSSSPFFGVHLLFLAPILLQFVIIILRTRKNKISRQKIVSGV